MSLISVDVLVDVQSGDCGKGRVVHDLLQKEQYTHCMRFNGGHNAGHTIFHKGQKYISHILPGGILFDHIQNVIGPGCVLNVDKFFEEVEYFENRGFNFRNRLFIAKNTHIITDDCIEIDKQDTKIGTCKTGNGPAYSRKYDRTGIRAESIPELKPFLIDIYNYFYAAKNTFSILLEGAQGFNLDIDWTDDYPYCTSSHTGLAGALLNGFNHSQVNNVYGVAKVYRTYVGNKKFQPDNDSILENIQDVGQEFGATTGRKRQCNYLDLNEIIKNCNINGVDNIIFNKLDILQEIGIYKLYHNNKLLEFNNVDDFKDYIQLVVPLSLLHGVHIFFNSPPIQK